MKRAASQVPAEDAERLAEDETEHDTERLRLPEDVPERAAGHGRPRR